MNKPLVTVITVVYNAASVLEQTILSVIHQTLDVEYIIIDGGSTDGSLEIIKKYENKINYWLSEPDEGIYDAMNKGLLRATGVWVSFMNAGDTFFDKNILLEINFNNFNNVDVLYGAILLKTKFIETIVQPLKINKLKVKMPFCHQAVFVKRNNIEFNTIYKLAADYNLFYFMYFNGFSFHQLNRVIAVYDGNGISSNNQLKFYREYYHIQKKNNYFIAFLVYIFNIFRHYITRFFECILPKSWITYRYKIKYNS